jgi:prepilin peptidase CpaA
MMESGVWPLILAAIFVAAMVVAMAWDLARFEIPDTLSVLLVVTALTALGAGGQGWSEFGLHGLSALAAFAFGVVLFGLGQWGGGDVKFMTAISLWLGWPGLFGYCLTVAVAGGVLAVAVLAFRRLTLPPAWAARPWLRRLHHEEEGLPYGVALGVAGLVFLRPAVASVLGG